VSKVLRSTHEAAREAARATADGEEGKKIEMLFS